MAICEMIKCYVLSRETKLLRYAWWIFHYSGLRAIYERISPPCVSCQTRDGYRKPSTFVLWAVGLYFGIFGIASTRYELYQSRVESRMNVALSQIGKEGLDNTVLELIPSIQHMKFVLKPEIYSPISIFNSLDNDDARYKKYPYESEYYDFNKDLSSLILSYYRKYINVDLSNSIILGVDLPFREIDKVSLSNSTLENVKFYMSDISFVDISGSILRNVEFSMSILYGLDMDYCDINNMRIGNPGSMDENHLKHYDMIVDKYKIDGVKSGQLVNIDNSIVNGIDIYDTDIDVSFIGSEVVGGEFRNCDLSFSEFSGSKLENIVVCGVVMRNANFFLADMNNMIIDGESDFNGAVFDGADMRCILDGRALRDGSSHSEVGRRVRCAGVDLYTMLLDNAESFRGALLPKAVEVEMRKRRPEAFGEPTEFVKQYRRLSRSEQSEFWKGVLRHGDADWKYRGVELEGLRNECSEQMPFLLPGGGIKRVCPSRANTENQF